MVEGAFSFLLFLFASPQQAIVNQLQGYWLVTIDNTEQERSWNRIYYFKKCPKPDRQELRCNGHYGWAEYDGVFQNLYDKNYLTYGIEKNSDETSGRRKFLLSGIYYDYILDLRQKNLQLFDTDSGNLVLEMKKVSKSDVRKDDGSI